MAHINLRSYRQKKAYHLLGVFCLILLVQKSAARDFYVGGPGGWRVPSDPISKGFNKWAESMRFQKGDSLVFVYQANQDSVLLVSKQDYDNCNTKSHIQSFSDGHTSFKLEKAGAQYHFISGNRDNCLKNEKLTVRVLSDRSKGSPTSPPAPAPSNSTTAATPPAPTPECDSRLPSVASSLYLSFIGLFGAFVVSSFVLGCQ